MSKLISRFTATRSLASAKALVTYLERHPMAICLATPHETHLIAEANAMVQG